MVLYVLQFFIVLIVGINRMVVVSLSFAATHIHLTQGDIYEMYIR